jgi:hypothetical protein
MTGQLRCHLVFGRASRGISAGKTPVSSGVYVLSFSMVNTLEEAILQLEVSKDDIDKRKE